MRKKKIIGIAAGVLLSGALVTTAGSAYSSNVFQATDSQGQETAEPAEPGTGTPPAAPDDGANGTPPPMPSGESGMPDGTNGNGTPPEKPDGEPPSGDTGNEQNVTLKGANTADGTEISYDGTKTTTSLVSSAADENTVLAVNGGSYLLRKAALSKTGDCSNTDNSNFYAVNAVAAAAKNSLVYLESSSIQSSAEGANGLFATGSNAKIYAKDTKITTTGNSSRGLDATYEGTIIASDLTIATSGEHCASIATDRGGGSISVSGGTLKTKGQGSPVLYSTGTIEVNNVTGEATGAQIVGMEGLNTVRIKNSTLTGSGKKASESVANGIILYQSTSGDSSEGTAEFEASDSTLKSYITDGAMFYCTNTAANIVLQNTKLDFDSDSNTLLTAAGNDASNGWGSIGSNGGTVTLTAKNQELSGNISCDGISNVTVYLTEGSVYTGTILEDPTYTGDGGVSMCLTDGTVWTVTKDTVLKSLDQTEGAKIQDASGKTVTVKTSDGETVVKGESDITIVTKRYSTENPAERAGTISNFQIDRTAYETYCAAQENASYGEENADPAGNDDQNGSAENSQKAPAATKIKKITAGSNALTISWKKVAGVTGYEIYRSTKKTGGYKKIATVSSKKTSYKDKGLKKNKKYYYKIKTYKKSGGQKLTGKASAVKGKRTKAQL